MLILAAGQGHVSAYVERVFRETMSAGVAWRGSWRFAPRNVVVAAMLAMIAFVAPPVRAQTGSLVNLSARAATTSGTDALTAGFVIQGVGPKRVLVRAAGPALAGFGVSGALEQVRLDLFRGQAVFTSNAGWDSGPDAAAVLLAARAAGAFEFTAGSKDAALLVTLEPGNYTAQVVPVAAARGVALVEIYDVDRASGSRLVNLSARARTGAGADTLIAGFVVAGGEGARLLVRGAGPALTAFGLPGALPDPQIEVFQNAASLGYNQDWQANTNAAQLADVARSTGAFAFGDRSRDAALLVPAANGPLTAQLSAATGADGVALAEIYDATAATSPVPNRVFDLVGFARVAGDGLAALTGGGAPTIAYDAIARTGNFWRIDGANAAAPNFAAQLQAALSSDAPLVVELNTMLDLSRVGRPNNGATAIAHPDLFAAGRTTGTVGTLSIGANKTVYSAYGNGGFRRGTLRIDGKSNIALRNLKFRELWEWDDATAGAYDRNDWDYLTVSSNTSGAAVTSRAHHIWIDHCDFEKSYDGLADLVHGTDLVTVSWCKIAGVVSGETGRWVQRQMDYLEANRTAFPYYNAQRASASAAEVASHESFQKKSNLVGNATDANTAAHDIGYLNVTFHHDWYVNVDQRMPRLRYGNAHVFNLLVDSSAGRDVSGLALMGVAATSNAAIRLEKSWFIDTRAPVTVSAGTEPPGNIAVIDSTNFDSVTRTDQGFDATRVTPLANFGWNRPAAASGLGGWPVADTAVMPAGYVPTGAALADYVDAKDFMLTHLAWVGVIVPANAVEAESLRLRWQTTTAAK